jgi:hypothetical protein
MSKKQKQTQVPATDAQVTAPEAAVATPPKTLRLPLAEAREHNKAFTFVAPDAAKSAAIALTAKGTNPKKARVYGYDNLADGGGVPKDKRILLVPGLQGVPKGVSQQQWDVLCAVAADGDVTVAGAKDSVTSRTIRRAYRAGYIRFSI